MKEKSEITIKGMNAETRIRLIASIEGKGAHLSFDTAVENFPKELINESPPHVPYTFWHQLEHIRIAQRDLTDYIKGNESEPLTWPDDYWPAKDATTDVDGWNATVESYRRDRRELIDYISNEDMNLLEPVPHMENRSILRSCLLVIDHASYHVGELVISRQTMGAWEHSLKK